MPFSKALLQTGQWAPQGRSAAPPRAGNRAERAELGQVGERLWVMGGGEQGGEGGAIVCLLSSCTKSLTTAGFSTLRG